MLEEAQREKEELLDRDKKRTAMLEEQLEEYKPDYMFRDEVSKVKEELGAAKERVKQLWKMSCEQVKMYDQSLSKKDDEITRSKEQLDRSRSPRSSVRDHLSEPDLDLPCPSSPVRTVRRGKAPPVDLFTGENPEVILDDWLPSLTWPSEWNGWTPDKLLLQLAGHLRGHALQEWTKTIRRRSAKQ